ncbi:ClpXP protease specificity-enhancing factor [Pontibacterium granulatum]|uniref:ClpXP protease specificity-enhancing factor n=1 Tax=Pontibacterium granulatum TaxID=2036029 RepID=UPI00249CA3AB|nr:ClpXP protease specificity-enhancing factor [Pontibacterium granulatum]MDI3323650.1 ClpXP protease specificity-enhancing factor [Pontibacterium granulatum]
MKPSRPYLLRALYEWMQDNDLTPHVVVNADWSGVVVPVQFVEDGQIVLNIAPTAVRGFMIDDQAVSFNARFGGVPMDVYIPLGAVIAIYARENAAGMGFGIEPGADLYDMEEQPPEPPEPEVPPKKKGPVLKVVK